MFENRANVAGMALALLVAAMIFASGVHADMFGWILPDAFTDEFWNASANSGLVVAPDYSWVGLSFFTILILALFATVGYMMSSVFGAKVKAFCTDMLKNQAKSVVILLIVAGAFVAVEQAPKDSLMFVGFFQIDNAINFAATVRNTIIYEFVTLTSITAILSSLANITPYFRPAGMIGISFSLAPAFRPIFDSLGLMLSSLSVAVGAWYVQLWFLVFVQTRLMAIVMPIGLFLRCFGLDRPGNVLIAIAIGFYFVFPFVLNVNAIALENYLRAEFGEEIYQSSDSESQFYDTWGACFSHSSNSAVAGTECFYRLSTSGALSFLGEYIANAGWENLLIFGLMQLLTGSLVASLGTAFLGMFLFSLMSATAYYVIVVSILMPLFNIFLTLTVIKEITRYLGTEIDLSAFEKIF